MQRRRVEQRSRLWPSAFLRVLAESSEIQRHRRRLRSLRDELSSLAVARRLAEEHLVRERESTCKAVLKYRIWLLENIGNKSRDSRAVLIELQHAVRSCVQSRDVWRDKRDMMLSRGFRIDELVSEHERLLYHSLSSAQA